MEENVKKIQKILGLKETGKLDDVTLNKIYEKVGSEKYAQALQRKVGVKDDGVIGKITTGAILHFICPEIKEKVDKLISIAKSQVGLKETSKNQGPGLEKLWTATTYPDGYKNREPYCAAGMCWVFQQSGLFSEKERPKTPSAFGWEAWGNGLPKKVQVISKPSSIKRGDAVIFSFSHIGIATSDSDKSGNFQSIEFNTNAQGSRDGDGVWEKTRNLGLVRSSISLL